MKGLVCLCTLAGMILASPAFAHSTEPYPLTASGAIRIENPWARATPPGSQVGGVYLTLRNTGGADRLVSGSSPVAGRVEIHRMSMEGGVMRMRQLPALELPANGVVEFKPGELHFMLVGLKQPLKEGERISLTLTFEKGGQLQVEVPVAEQGAMSPASTQHKGH